MKKLLLAGKAPPKFKKRKTTPFPSGDLTGLVALDPRHGVFPNLVATPLLATVMAFFEDGNDEQLLKILEQARAIVADDSPRRFNVLCKPDGKTLQLDCMLAERLARHDPENEIWLVFKYSTVNALIIFLLTGETEFTRKHLDDFGERFLSAALSAPGCELRMPERRTTQAGVLFRLLADEDPKGIGAVSHLRHAIRKISPKKDIEHLLKILRSFIPLLHNEAYDQPVVGLAQNRFMTAVDLRPNSPEFGAVPPDPYWRFIGNAIKRRIQS